MSMDFKFALNGATHAVKLSARQPELLIDVDGETYHVSEASALAEQCVLLTVNGRSYQVWRTWEGDRIHLRIAGRAFSVGYQDAIAAAQHLAGGDDVLRSDMPGVVVNINCAAGAQVDVGDTLMVIESMKMQINIIAPRNGVVEAVHLNVNDTFEKGAELILLHAED